MTQISSHQAAQNIGKGTAEKMSLQTTRWLQETSRDDVDVTLRGSSSQTRQRRPEKLGRRQSTTVYDGRPVMMMMMMLSEDDLKRRGPIFLVMEAVARVETVLRQNDKYNDTLLQKWCKK